ncbi:MAG: leucine-rich repeat protein, partial [Paludibacteraceae bacterium]|nr:leucine-rich repeat protein [Paludibacteraceae bacterium]
MKNKVLVLLLLLLSAYMSSQAASRFVGAGTKENPWKSCGSADKYDIRAYVSNDTLYVYGSGQLYNYGSIGATAGWRTSSYFNTIKVIVIGEGIERIGNFTFASFTNLKSVYIPSTVNQINQGAFQSSGAANFYFSGTNPPRITSNPTFQTTSQSQYYVPCSALSTYKTATGQQWNQSSYKTLAAYIHGLSSMVTRNYQVCPGRTVNVRGVNYGVGTYHDVILPGLNGQCDTMATIVVTPSPLSQVLRYQVCPGKKIRIRGAEYGVGTYSGIILIGQDGQCDTTATIVVTQKSETVIKVTHDHAEFCMVCPGKNFKFRGQEFPAGPNTYRASGVGDDCDTLFTLYVSAYDQINVNLPITLCQGEEWSDGKGITIPSGHAGPFNWYWPGIDQQCDTQVHYMVTRVPKPIISSRTYYVCEGSLLTLNGTDYAPGTYSNITIPSLTTYCDTTITQLNVIERAPELSDLNVALCPGGSYTWEGTTYTSADVGDYVKHFTSVHGCDSTVTLHLTVHPTYSHDIEASICQGDSYLWEGSTYTAGGDYTKTLVN